MNQNRSSELLLSIPFAKRHPPTPSPITASSESQSQSLVPTQISDVAPSAARHPHAPPLQTRPEELSALELEFEAHEADLLFSARTFMETREPMRAIHVLRQCRSSKAHFLSLYSQFIVSSCYSSNHLF
jgi:anaphase-promoting complex subunit 8